MDEQGRDNWTFAGLETDEDDTAVAVVIRQAAISNAAIHYSMPDLPPVILGVTALNLSERSDQGLQFELTGAVNDTELLAAGELGTPDEIIEGINVPFEVTAELGEIEIIANGLIDDLYDPRQPAIAASIEGPNAEYLTGILGIDPVTAGPFSFNAGITPYRTP